MSALIAFLVVAGVMVARERLAHRRDMAEARNLRERMGTVLHG